MPYYFQTAPIFPQGRPVLVLCPGDSSWSDLSVRRKLEAIGDTVFLDAAARRKKSRRAARFQYLVATVRDSLAEVCCTFLGRTWI